MKRRHVPHARGVFNVGPGVVSTGWLAANSVFEHKQEQKLSLGIGASLVLHGVFLAIVLYVFAMHPDTVAHLQDEFARVVYMQQPGPGGGGGGSPSPAPKKPTEIPQPKTLETVPMTPPPVVPPEIAPPQLVASVMTNLFDVVQASGASSASLATWGGGGTGQGVGPGRGPGVGPGSGGGQGGDIYQTGNGVTVPVKLNDVKPNYTSDAMRMKIQGDVEMQAVVRKDGTVGDVRVTRSLDRTSGLDDQAIRAAKLWMFTPATKDGTPVDVYVRIVIAFRLR